MRDLTRGPSEFLPLTHLTYHILLVLAGTQLHGYRIIKEIAERTGGRMRPETGTLYTAIRRMREEGLIEPVVSAEGREIERRGHSYRLTALGRQVLEGESERLARLVEVAREKRVLGTRPVAETSQ